MKILKLSAKDEVVKLRVDSADDMWILSRLLNKGDKVGAETSRAIKKGEDQESKKKLVYLKIEIEKIELQNDGTSLKLLGKIYDSHYEDIPNQSHHSILLEEGFNVDVYKKLKQWEVKRLKDAEAVSKNPKVIICAVDYGEATIAAAKQFGVDYITDVSKNISGKKKETLKEYEKDRKEFMVDLAKTLEEISTSRKIEKIIIGGIGFFNESFKKELDKFPKLLSKIVFTKISNPGKPGISEIIRKGTLASVTKESRIDKETKAIENFFAQISKEHLVAYGMDEVKKASEASAILSLLVSEELIQKLREEKKFIELEKIIEDTESSGGEVIIISAQHDVGQQFSKIGIGALLKFNI